MELVAHHKQYKDYMNPKTQDAFKKALIDAQKHGADIEHVMNEMNRVGDDFGSPEHMKELHNKAVKGVEFHQNHKELISGESDESKQAIEDAMKHGSHGDFEEFTDKGFSTKPKFDTQTGKPLPTGDKFDTQTGKPKEKLGHHHLLHTLDPIQQKHADALKKAQKAGDKEAYDKAANALEESGVPKEDIHHLTSQKFNNQTGEPLPEGTKKDEETGDGPPDPEVARKKMAEGYVWHKETRHWILKETLQQMKGGHGGFDASIVSGGHQGKGGAAFALNEQGKSSDKSFLFLSLIHI